MTTRRQVLGWAGLVGLGAVAGCGPDAPAPPSGPAPKDVLVLEGPDGVTVFSTATGAVLVPAGPAVVSSDGRGLARAQAVDGGTRLFSHRLPRGEQVFSGVLTGALAPRVVAPDSMLVALANPGATPYRPGRRDRTTIVVADAAGQRARLDLPGNLEPEAFDPAGRLLYVLDYVPPVAPDRYRVRVVDLASGTVQPLLTRDKSPVPSGAEEEMRGEGRQAVYDGNRDTLFTLYTHQPDHVHTRNLIDAGAREEAPHVHAFVHTLNLGGQWAYCVDLPAPFGENPAAGHAIARDPGGRVVVVDATSGSGLFIDPDGLTVQETFAFARAARSDRHRDRAVRAGRRADGRRRTRGGDPRRAALVGRHRDPWRGDRRRPALSRAGRGRCSGGSADRRGRAPDRDAGRHDAARGVPAVLIVSCERSSVACGRWPAARRRSG